MLVRPRSSEGGLGEWNESLEANESFGWDAEDRLGDYEVVGELEIVH